MDLLIFIIFGVCWTSSMYRLLFSSINLGSFSKLFLWIFFLLLSPSPFLLVIHYASVGLVASQTFLRCSFIYILFSLCASEGCIISINLSSSSLILSSTSSNVPSSLSVSFHFSYYTFQFLNDLWVLLHNFCLFIYVVYIMQHCHHCTSLIIAPISSWTYLSWLIWSCFLLDLTSVSLRQFLLTVFFFPLGVWVILSYFFECLIIFLLETGNFR